MGFGYCQNEIEGQKKCKQQCDHCKTYYKPLEKMEYWRKLLRKVEDKLFKYNPITPAEVWQTKKYYRNVRLWLKYADEKKRIVNNIKACKSENENDMCDECDCWKQTRANCS